MRLFCDNLEIVKELLVKLIFARMDYALKQLPFAFEQRNADKRSR